MNKKVLIIGGGASGAILAAMLLKTLEEASSVIVVEPNPLLGRGLAYSGNSHELLLNVRAASMSIFPDEPGDFVAWLEKNGFQGAAQSFMPRRLFGDYVADRLREAAAQSRATFVHIKTRAEEVQSNGDTFSVALADGSVEQEISNIVIAIGNQRSIVPEGLESLLGSPELVLDPFEDTLLQVRDGEELLILGSGLTCIDTITTVQQQGKSCRVHVRSRTGHFPHVHTNPSPQISTPLPSEFRAATKQLITLCREAGSDWRRYLDGVRQQTPAIWQGWSWSDRERFLRRFGTFWNIHRHRVPLEAWNPIAESIDQGVINIAKGRLHGVERVNGRIEAKFHSETITCDRIVCCMTPSGLASAHVPVIDKLVASGFASYDPLGIGLVHNEDLTLNDNRIYGIGPVAKGCLLESTAIPEIRVQARRVASQIRNQ